MQSEWKEKIGSNIVMTYEEKEKIGSNIVMTDEEKEKIGSNIVMTDEEGDDMFALLLSLTDSPPTMFVVGEGDSSIQARRMKKFVDLCKPILGTSYNPRIVTGMSSKKTFYMSDTELSELPKFEGERDFPMALRDLCANELGHKTMIVIKPPRELFELFKADHEAFRDLTSKMDTYMYGSFNFRSIFNDYKDAERDKVMKEFKTMLHSFGGKLVIYESFCVSGHLNSINSKNAHQIHTWFEKHKDVPIVKFVLKMMQNWNRNILKTQLEEKKKLEEEIDMLKKITGTSKELLSKQEELLRSDKVINNVKDYINFQFVLGDIGLLAVLGKIEPLPIMDIHFDEKGYTNYTLLGNGKSNMYAYGPIPYDRLEDLILERLKILEKLPGFHSS